MIVSKVTNNTVELVVHHFQPAKIINVQVYYQLVHYVLIMINANHNYVNLSNVL
jgi:hypothetical protein